jgi:hypothetical protein
LPESVLQIAEDVFEAEALKIVFVSRQTVLEVLLEGLQHPHGEIGPVIKEGTTRRSCECSTRCWSGRLQRRRNRRR